MLYFNAEAVERHFCSLDFSIPTDELLNIDWSAWQQRLENQYSLEDQYMDLLQTTQRKMERVQIGYLEVDKLISLLPKLKQHREYLDSARESLRKFIQENFSLSDVLYVTK